MVLSTRGRCNDVEQRNIAWTKNPVFRNPDFSGMSIASLPGQKTLFTFLSVVQYEVIVNGES